ncbi:MAG: CoA transferase, partial [Sphingobium sp.]
YFGSGKPPRRSGNRHPNIQPQDVFPCKDGFVVIVVGNDGQYAKFCEEIGRPDLIDDPLYRTNGDRVSNLATLMPEIVEALSHDTMKGWVMRLELAGVPCAPINTVPDVLADPQALHRGMKIEMDHPVSGTLSMLANPMRFADAALEYRRPPPMLGEHGEEIRRELDS